MYEPSRHVKSFHIAGFQHYDGALVLGKLKPGMKLKMVPNPENPYDPNAVELRYKKTKLGFVPRTENADIALMAFMATKAPSRRAFCKSTPRRTPGSKYAWGFT